MSLLQKAKTNVCHCGRCKAIFRTRLIIKNCFGKKLLAMAENTFLVKTHL